MGFRRLACASCVMFSAALAACGDDAGGGGGSGGSGDGGSGAASASETATSGENTPIPSTGASTATASSSDAGAATASSTDASAASGSSGGQACEPAGTFAQYDGCDYLCERREELCGAADATCLQRCGDLYFNEICQYQAAQLRACELAQRDVEADCAFTDYTYEGPCCQAEMEAVVQCFMSSFP